MRFLIVDDDPMNRELLDGMLCETAACFQVGNGKEALAAFQTAWNDCRPFDLILLDIMMPEMDGAEVIEQIRSFEMEKKVSQRHRVKILMVTAVANESMVRECVQKGCDDYIVKPITLQTIYRKLDKLKLLA